MGKNLAPRGACHLRKFSQASPPLHASRPRVGTLNSLDYIYSLFCLLSLHCILIVLSQFAIKLWSIISVTGLFCHPVDTHIAKIEPWNFTIPKRDPFGPKKIIFSKWSYDTVLVIKCNSLFRSLSPFYCTKWKSSEKTTPRGSEEEISSERVPKHWD